MQVPAYWPVVEGVQLDEKSGVFVEVKRTTSILSVEPMAEFEVDEVMSITQSKLARGM